MQDQADSLVGQVVDDTYELIALLGSGASGAVYKARHNKIDRLSAIKILHASAAADEQASKRFTREARTTSKLEHDNIITVSAFGIWQGRPYLVMEYLEGESLASLLKRKGKLDPTWCRQHFAALADALAYAHEQGVVHRDVKPSNIIVCEKGLKLIDFGIARIMNPDASGSKERLTAVGSAIGSPLYMSPEQCLGADADKQSDIYGLGCVMYECLSGQAPFQGESSLDIMNQQVNIVPPDLSTGDRELNQTVKMCLQKDRQDRYQLSNLLAEDLRASHRRHLPSSGNKRQPRQLVVAAALTTVVLLAVTLLATSALWPSSPKAQDQPVPFTALRIKEINEHAPKYSTYMQDDVPMADKATFVSRLVASTKLARTPLELRAAWYPARDFLGQLSEQPGAQAYVQQILDEADVLYAVRYDVPNYTNLEGAKVLAIKLKAKLLVHRLAEVKSDLRLIIKSIERSNSVMRPSYCYDLGTRLVKAGLLEEGRHVYELGLLPARGYKNEYTAALHHYLAEAAFKLNQPDQALKHLQACLAADKKYPRTAGFVPEEGGIYRHTGLAYAQLHDFGRARAHLGRALQYFKDHKRTDMEVVTAFELAQCDNTDHNQKAAKEHFTTVLALRKQVQSDNRYFVICSARTLGEMAFSDKRWQDCQRYYELVLSTPTNDVTGQDELRPNDYLMLAQCLEKQGQPEAGKAYREKARIWTEALAKHQLPKDLPLVEPEE